MKKILNTNVDRIVEESHDGYVAAYSRLFEAIEVPDGSAFKLKKSRKNKVALVIGGGSGHEPLFSGFVGKGLGDAVVDGAIFTSPTPPAIYETAKAVESGQGVLFLYGNYAGDNMNFDMAEEMLQDEGMKTAHLRVWDDCASAPKERCDERRGIAGDIFTIKIAGAACDAGLSLEEVLRITEKVRENINSIGLATAPGSIPGSEDPTFELPEGEIEFGMGLHGEPGIERTTMKPADQLVDRMYSELKTEMNLKKDDEVAVLINSLGSTTLMELNVVYYELNKHLQETGLKVHDAEIKTYCTCQEMSGFSITILKLDEELKLYYDTPCYSPYYAREAIED